MKVAVLDHVRRLKVYVEEIPRGERTGPGRVRWSRDN
jgi:hypothetical protein